MYTISFTWFFFFYFSININFNKGKKNTQIEDTNTFSHSINPPAKLNSSKQRMLLTQVQQAETLLEQRERAGTSFGKPLLRPFVIRVWIRACPLVGYAGMPGGPILRGFLAGIAGSHRIRVQGKSFLKLHKLPPCVINCANRGLKKKKKEKRETKTLKVLKFVGNAIGIITINILDFLIAPRGTIKFLACIASSVSLELNFKWIIASKHETILSFLFIFEQVNSFRNELSAKFNWAMLISKFSFGMNIGIFGNERYFIFERLDERFDWRNIYILNLIGKWKR